MHYVKILEDRCAHQLFRIKCPGSQRLINIFDSVAVQVSVFSPPHLIFHPRNPNVLTPPAHTAEMTPFQTQVHCSTVPTTLSQCSSLNRDTEVLGRQAYAIFHASIRWKI